MTMTKFLFYIFFCMSVMASHGGTLLLGEKRVDLDLNGFELGESRTAKNRKTYYVAAKLPGTEINFLITAEYNHQILDSALLREQWWKMDKKKSAVQYLYQKLHIWKVCDSRMG